MSQASTTTLFNQKDSGNALKSSERIFDYIQAHPGCNISDMRGHLQIPYRSLTPRISDLMDEGRVVEMGFCNIDGRVLSIYRAETDPHQMDWNRRLRERKMFLKWINRGLNTYSPIISDVLKFELNRIKQELEG